MGKLRKIMEQDFCTHAPDELFGVDLSSCCRLHDKAYRIIRRKKIPLEEALKQKKLSDITFRNCLSMKAWWMPPIAWMYYVAVRLFGMIRERMGMVR